MPSPEQSTPQVEALSLSAIGEEISRLLIELEAIEGSMSGAQLLAARERLRETLEQCVEAYNSAGIGLPPEVTKRAVARGIRSASRVFPVDEAERIAAKLFPDIQPGQARDLASAKARVGRLVAVLLGAQAEARSIVDALHHGHATPTGEPDYIERSTPEEVAELEPGRYCLSVSFTWLARSGLSLANLFSRSGDDLAAEIWWATDVDDQLSDMIRRLGELAVRDEQRKLRRRRNLIVEYLSPGSCSDAQLADD
jgi:hypothetical protein